MRKYYLVPTSALLLSILAVQAPSVTYAQSPAISNGLNWLNSVQSADGSWDSVSSTADIIPTTSAALESLVLLSNNSSQNYVNAANWLAAQQIDTTRSLAERLSIFSTSTADKDVILSYLDNLTRAWGGYDDYTVDILDTALALQALKAANYSDTTVLFQAINYLTTNQNADGGWGFRAATSVDAGDPSNAYTTAIVLKALFSYNSLFLLQDSINKASAYLLSKQNPDGGFGSSPSNVYETALSIVSLIESGQGGALPLQNAINYLTSSQQTNGSWNDDPYYTALALQALAAARPNLSVASISLSNPMPQENVETTITATIKNIGYEDATGVVIRFYLGDPNAGGIQLGTDQIIPSLPVGGSAQASITASFTGTGGKTIFVKADPDNIISETSETDNVSSARIWIATAPDLAVFSEDLKPSTYVPAPGTAFTLSYTIRNLGESPAGEFDIALYDGQPGGTPLQTVHISGLNGTEVRTGSLGVTLTGNGAHTLYLVADSGNAVTEISETNNIGTVMIQVGGIQKYADLAAGRMQIMPSRPHANDVVAITAFVSNQGYEEAGSFTVELFDGSPDAGGTLIQSQTVSSLASGATFTITANWTISSGIHDVYLIADRTNQISETNEANNAASVKIMTDMVDISLSATDLTFTPAHPVNGDTVTSDVNSRHQVFHAASCSA